MSETPAESTVQLSGDVHDLLLSYQREDEDLGETLDRVMQLVPHPVRLPDRVDPGEVENERLVIERQYDEDRYLDTFVYESGFELHKQCEDAIDHV